MFNHAKQPDMKNPVLQTDGAEESLNFEKQICFSLYAAANAMVRAYRPLLAELDLTYLQYMVLLILWEQDGISVTHLGSKLHLDSGTLTPLLKRLETKGLIKRKVSQKDERVKCLFLTDAGCALRTRAIDIPRKILCKTSLPLEELQALKQQCDHLLCTLSED
jgi:DNA-binding MarR family transcriptional regulator